MNGRSAGHRNGIISQSSSLCCCQKFASFCFAFSSARSAFCFAFSSYPEGASEEEEEAAGVFSGARPFSISTSFTVSCFTLAPFASPPGTEALIAAEDYA